MIYRPAQVMNMNMIGSLIYVTRLWSELKEVNVSRRWRTFSPECLAPLPHPLPPAVTQTLRTRLKKSNWSFFPWKHARGAPACLRARGRCEGGGCTRPRARAQSKVTDKWTHHGQAPRDLWPPDLKGSNILGPMSQVRSWFRLIVSWSREAGGLYGPLLSVSQRLTLAEVITHSS